MDGSSPGFHSNMDRIPEERVTGRCRILGLFWIWISLAFVSFKPVESATLNIAWMAPKPFFFFFNASTSMGALAYSIKEIKDKQLIHTYDKFDVKFKNSGCNSKDGIGAIFDFLEEGYDMDFIMGPACSPAMKPVAELASHLNLPAFGWISSDPVVADKTSFTTLVRFLWPIAAIGDGMIILLRKTEWKHLFLISTTGSDYGQLGSSIRDAIEANEDDGFNIARWVQEVPTDPDRDTMGGIFSQAKGEARIIVLSTPFSELRNWMLAAYDAGMSGGSYVFLYANQATPQQADVESYYSTDFWTRGDGRDEDARKIYGSLLMMLAKPTADFAKTQQFLDDFEVAASPEPWINPIGITPTKPDFYSLFLYDAMKLYAWAANQTGTVKDGGKIFQKAAGSLTPDGATGDVILDDNADRVPDYWFFDMDEGGHFDIFAETVSVKDGANIVRSLNIIQDFIWGDGSKGLENAPPDIPKCDFDGSKCEDYTLYIALGVVGGVLVLLSIGVFFLCRKLRYERALNNMVWKINYDDVHVYTGGRPAGSMYNMRAQSQHLRSSKGSVQESMSGQIFITVANYRGNTVAIKKVRKNRIKLERELLREMRMMVEVKHNNLNAFIGACIDAPNVCCAWEYCPKGSLQDVIGNDDIDLDDMFKFAIATDVLKGLMYVHDSDLKHHGKMKSSNIVIDGRWVSKITDYGVECFTAGEEPNEDESDHTKYTSLFWTAPEVLRDHSADLTKHTGAVRGTHSAADLYSMGIILKEIFCRNEPYCEHVDHAEPEEIVTMVIKPESGSIYRPSLEDLERSLKEKSIAHKLSEIIRSCWAEDAKDRPTAHHTMKTLTKTNPSKKNNVLDNMMAMMEKYTNQLEGIVTERTMQLQEEKKKTENLLYKMLPRSVAEDLKVGKPVQAESFDVVTIYFSDVVGFAEVAEVSTPFQIVDLLNALYSLIDEIITQHDVYKVETVGDVYLLVSGLPVRNGDRHVVEVVNCAMDIISGTHSFKVPHKPSHKIGVRVGVHTGPVVAGVIGLTNPRYCLFGDTVNTSSRMESNGFACRIHLSPFSYAALSKFGGYHMAERGVIQVKGKGAMTTYWLLGRDGYDKPLPDYEKIILHGDTPAPKRLPVTTGKNVAPRVIRPSMESGFSELGDATDAGETPSQQQQQQKTQVTTQAGTTADRTQTSGLPVVEISSAS